MIVFIYNFNLIILAFIMAENPTDQSKPVKHQ